MEVLKFAEEQGVTVPSPYHRHIRVMLAPDRRNVPEITFSQVLLYPESSTDAHAHDRPELIIVTAGRGVSVCEGKKTSIEPEMALWIPAGETHQIINNTDETYGIHARLQCKRATGARPEGGRKRFEGKVTLGNSHKETAL